MMWRPSIILTLLVAATGFRCGYAKTCDGNCYSSGDPHYQTFDCQKFEYHGQCSYTLVETCDASLPYFEIIGDNERMEYHPKYAYTKHVIIRTTDQEIKLTADKLVFINGDEHKGETIEIKNATISKTEHEIVIEHVYGFNVTWGSPFKAEITLTNDNLKGKVCGICGNANGDAGDDLVTPEKKKVADPVSFADSWNTEENCGPCADCREDVCADKPTTTVSEAGAKCTVFTDKKGVLEPCFETLEPTYHHHLCISDLCEHLPDNSSLCDVVADYVEVCQSYDIFKNQTISIGNCNGAPTATLTEKTVKCQAIPQIQAGGYKPSDSDFRSGSILSFGCDFGFSLVGAATVTCQSDGKWSGSAPTCVNGDLTLYKNVSDIQVNNRTSTNETLKPSNTTANETAVSEEQTAG